MEPRDLNRMFDRLAPTADQEQAVLDRLLQTERKDRPMKKLKKLTVIGVAAALMVISCAAAVVTGIDQRLIDYFGGGTQMEELLLPGAMAVDVSTEDNGAVLHITQVLRDRYNITVLGDFTAPEGTVLDAEGTERSFAGFSLDDEGVLFFDSDGMPVSGEIADGYAYTCGWRLLDDGNPKDNHLSLLFHLTVPEGLKGELDIASFRIAAEDPWMVERYTGAVDLLYAGNWSLEVPLPQKDMGCTQKFDQNVGELDGSAIRLKEVYLSPVTLMVTLERESDLTGADAKTSMRWFFALDGEHFAAANGYEPAIDRTILTDRDGNEIPLECIGGSANLANLKQQYYPFRLAEAASVERLQGGTLTLKIEDGSVDIPLNGLVPVG